MILIYATYPNKEEAQDISRRLLEARLVACANIFQPHASMYWWEGEITSADEVAVIYKTQRHHFEAVQELISQRHSYDVPCVVSMRLQDLNAEFMQWIADEADGAGA